MKVEISWREEVSYRSNIEVDDTEFLEWLNESAPEADAYGSLDDIAPELLPALVRDFFTSGDASEWFEQTDTQKDFCGVDDRVFEMVERVER